MQFLNTSENLKVQQYTLFPLLTMKWCNPSQKLIRSQQKEMSKCFVLLFSVLQCLLLT